MELLLLAARTGFTDTLWIIATRHWVISDRSSFSAERSCARTPGDTHLWWGGFPQLVGVWPTSPSFYISLCRRPGKKCLAESRPAVAVTYNTPRFAPSPLWESGHEGTKQTLSLKNFYSGTRLICCHKQKEYLSQILSADCGFPSAIISMETETSSDTAGDSQMWEMKGNE